MKIKKTVFLSIAMLSASIALVAFAATKKTADEVPMNAPVLVYRTDFRTEPATVEANEPVNLRFEFINEAGKSVRFLEKVHEKPLHLMIISDDLEEFYHVHPELMTDYFALEQTFPFGGKYHLFADFTPPGGKNTVEHFTVEVKGKPRRRVALKEDKELTKTSDGLKVTMSADREIRAREDFLMTFSLADEETNEPATDMQLYLAALAHVAVFSEDLSGFIHAHPLEAGEIFDPMKGAAFHSHDPNAGDKKLIGPSPSEVKVPMIFPKAGLYKLFAQFQRNGRVIAVPFIVSVGEAKAQAIDTVKVPAGAVVVKVSKTGYEPSRIQLPAGKPVKLAFQRIDAENCGSKVVFPALNITRNLPVGQTVIVEFTPTKAEEIRFTCGMGMYKGTLVLK